MKQEALFAAHRVLGPASNATKREKDLATKQLLAHAKPTVQRLAGWFGRTRAVTDRVPLEDLEVMAEAALWNAIASYKFRCQQCSVVARTREAFERHELERHEKSKGPWPPINAFAQGKIGRALHPHMRRALNEANRFKRVRPDKERPEKDELDDIAARDSSPDQNVAFVQLVERAGRELTELHAEVMMRIVEGSTDEIWPEEAREVGQWLKRIA